MPTTGGSMDATQGRMGASETLNSGATRGPWRNPVLSEIVDADGRRIAWLGWGLGRISAHVSAEESTANARLIAVAPRMYALLEEAAEKNCRCGKATRCFTCRAHAILSEAKGA